MTKSNTIQYTIKQSSSKARHCVLLFVLLSPAFAKAQRQKVYTNMVWIGHYSTVKFSDRFSVNSDVQFRTKDWVQKRAQQLVRSGISYKVNPNLSLTLGGAWFMHAQQAGEKIIWRNEWRSWQEASYGMKGDKLSIMHRLRLEQRFLQKIVSGQKTADYDQITRLRYRLEFQVPVIGTKVTSSLINEFMVNPGHWGGEKFLDQYRTFVGVNMKVSPSTIVQAQYMKIFMWRTNNLLEDQNVLRFNIHQQFNRKK